MRIYILNHYIGGTPMDSHTIGVYTTKEKAIEEFYKSFETFGYKQDDEDIVIEHSDLQLFSDDRIDELELLSKNVQMNVISTWFIDDESSDFWGGCEIQVMEIND